VHAAQVTEQMTSPTKKWKLSIHLAKPNTEIAECINKDLSVQSQEIKHGAKLIGTLYHRKLPAHQPSWLGFFDGLADDSKFRVSSMSAVLFILCKNRVFALTFGHGRHLLEPAVFEDDFGLKVCLNTIDPISIRSVDRVTIDAQGRHGREQSSKPTSISEFGLDVEQDILRAVTGSPSLKEFGGKITGHNSLTAHPALNIKKIKAFLELTLSQSRKKKYKNDFPWIDHIQEVHDPSEKENLDNEFIDKLNTGDHKKLWMAIPEIVNWSSIKGFTYSTSKNAVVHEDINIDSYLEAGRVAETVERIKKSKKIYCRNITSNNIQYVWPAYRCFYAEISNKNNLYILTNGKWYQVDPKFRDSVNRSVAQIKESSKVRLPKYNDKDEPTYLKRVAENSSRLALMDCKNIPFGGGASRIEFCDLYDKRKVMIHVKRYGGSSVLSHLFQQGLVSSTLFCSDSEFRKLVNKKLPSSHNISSPNENPDPRDFEIAFAIVSDQVEKLNIPFFSQVGLRSVYRQLSAFGYKVTLTKIQASRGNG